MTIRNRLAKLEANRGPNRALQDMSDAELEARIATLHGLHRGEPVSDELLQKIIDEANVGAYGALQ